MNPDAEELRQRADSSLIAENDILWALLRSIATAYARGKSHQFIELMKRAKVLLDKNPNRGRNG